jgi:hypothetical protein
MLGNYLKSTHLFYALLVAGLALIGYTYRYQSPENLQAISTVVLVAITAWYSYQLRETVEETRKGRERGAIVEIIRDGIDPMLSIVERHQSTDSREGTDDRTTLPEYTWENNSSENTESLYLSFSNASIPMDEPVRKDIERDSTEVVELCKEYADLYGEYSDNRSEIKNKIRKHIQDNFINDKREWIESIDGLFDKNKWTIESRYEIYANCVIEQNWDRNWEVKENKEYFRSIRSNYIDELTELQNKRSELVEKRSEVERVLRDIRQHYVSTYHIREVQLENSEDR